MWYNGSMSKFKSQMLTSFVKLGVFGVVFLAIIFATVLLSKQMRTDEETRSKLAGLPKISIYLNDVTLDTVKAGTKDIKYPDNEVVLTDGEDESTFENVELKGRGNSTWGWAKSPYQIKFKEKTDFLGMGKGKKWILLANYFDMSNLRNAAAFKLEAMLDQYDALMGKFAELYIDGDYQGVYFVTEKIDIGKDRIDLDDELGVVVELENLHDGEECYYTKNETCLVVKDAVNEDLEAEAIADFVEDFGEMELAALNGDYETVKALIDVESLAKYYLLSEFTSNPDAWASSWYFYKNGLDDKIHVGPGWDFDYALSNKTWAWAEIEQFYEPTSEMLRLRTIGGEVYDEETGEVVEVFTTLRRVKLLYYLLDVPEFSELVRQTYMSHLFGRKEEMLAYLKIQAGKIRQSAILDIAKYDRDRELLWDSLGGEIYSELPALQINYKPELLFDTEVDYLLKWVRARFDYLDFKYSLSYGIMVM